MEKLEFYNDPDGIVWVKDGGNRHVFSQWDREIIEYVLSILEKFYPQTLTVLREKNSASAPNKYYYEFLMVDEFVRCNFGEHDMLNSDIDHGEIHFEEVRCPLRGRCKYEGVICKPRKHVPLSREEYKAAKLYSNGLQAEEIANRLGKGIKTIKCQLNSARHRLNLVKLRDLIKYFHMYNL